MERILIASMLLVLPDTVTVHLSCIYIPKQGHKINSLVGQSKEGSVFLSDKVIMREMTVDRRNLQLNVTPNHMMRGFITFFTFQSFSL
jgi:hypothetical protein